MTGEGRLISLTCEPQMLARKIPYAGWRQEDIVRQVQEGARPKWTDVPAGRSSPEVRAMVERCWDETPSVRPTMSEVVECLRSWVPASSAVAAASRAKGGDALDALLG
jgi:hypothetical protein